MDDALSTVIEVANSRLSDNSPGTGDMTPIPGQKQCEELGLEFGALGNYRG